MLICSPASANPAAEDTHTFPQFGPGRRRGTPPILLKTMQKSASSTFSESTQKESSIPELLEIRQNIYFWEEETFLQSSLSSSIIRSQGNKRSTETCEKIIFWISSYSIES